MAIDHKAAESGDWVRRYAAQKLAEPDAELFESHLVTCDQCQRDLAEIDMLRSGFREAEKKGWLSVPRAEPRWLRPYAIAATVVVSMLSVALLRDRLDVGIRVTAATDSVVSPQTTWITLRASRSNDPESPDAIFERGPTPSVVLLEIEVPRRCSDGSEAPLCADGSTPSMPAHPAYRLRLDLPTDGRAVDPPVAQIIGPETPQPGRPLVFAIPGERLQPGTIIVSVDAASGRDWVAIGNYRLKVR